LKSASLQYANALADIAMQQGAAEAALQQLTDFAAAYGESAELRNFLTSPAVSRAAKHGVIEKLSARLDSSKIVRNLLFVMVDKQRAHLLPEILERFREVIRQRECIAEAEVVSAVELSAAQKAEFGVALTRLTGKRVEAKYSLKPSLLGGAVVRVGDTVYDGSLRQRLEEMHTRLAAE
jgi:F-type H+-transporting ATPase subunit delta